MKDWREILARLLIPAVSLAVFYFFGSVFTARYDITGDEPHYLMVAHSLAWDGDLDLANNFERRDYRHFFPVPFFTGHRLIQPDGRMYSAHGIGLPLILAGPYRFGGLRGARLLMMVIASWLALGLWDLSRQLGLSAQASLFGWLTGSFTIPLLFFSFMIFNELPAALLFVWAFGSVLARPAGPPGPVRDLLSKAAIILAVAFWPWLHFRYALFSIFILVLLAWQVLTRRIASGRFFLSLAVLCFLLSLLGLYFYLAFAYQTTILPMFGSRIIYGNFWQGVLGLFLDRGLGLLLFSPAYALALAGSVVLLKRGPNRIELGCLAGLIIFYLAALGSYYRWDAGTAPIGRYLVPVLPFLAVAAGAAYGTVLGSWRSWLGRAVWAASFLLAAAGLVHRIAIYANPDGVNHYALALAQYLGLDLTGWLPQLYPVSSDYGLAWGWLAVFLALNLFFLFGRVRIFKEKDIKRKEVTS